MIDAEQKLQELRQARTLLWNDRDDPKILSELTTVQAQIDAAERAAARMDDGHCGSQHTTQPASPTSANSTTADHRRCSTHRPQHKATGTAPVAKLQTVRRRHAAVDVSLPDVHMAQFGGVW